MIAPTSNFGFYSRLLRPRAIVYGPVAEVRKTELLLNLRFDIRRRLGKCLDALFEICEIHAGESEVLCGSLARLHRWCGCWHIKLTAPRMPVPNSIFPHIADQQYTQDKSVVTKPRLAALTIAKVVELSLISWFSRQ